MKISGLTEAETVAAGKFKVSITKFAKGTEDNEDTPAETVITFNTGDVKVGDTIRVSYRRRVVSAGTVAAMTNGTTAKGELFMHFPVYSDGSDCTESAMKGMVHFHVYRCRVTQTPGFDASYKTAGTYGLTFAAMDPKLAHGKMYEVIYETYDVDGNIQTETTVSDDKVDWGIANKTGD